MLNKQLLLTQFAAVGCLGEGGHRARPSTSSPFSAGLLYVMYRCFDAVCVYKPAARAPPTRSGTSAARAAPNPNPNLTLTLTRYATCKGLRLPTLTLTLTLTQP